MSHSQSEHGSDQGSDLQLPSVLFFGASGGDELQQYLLRNERGGIQWAAIRASEKFLKAFDSGFKKQCDVLCSMVVSTYPRFKCITAFKLPAWSRSIGVRGHYVPYINLPIVRYPTTFLSATFHIAKWALRQKKRDPRLLVTYSIYTPHAAAIVLVAKMLSIPCLMIVPDLPEFMRQKTGMSIFELVARRVNESIAHTIARHFDYLVLFTQSMVEKLYIGRKKYVVIEGCTDEENGAGIIESKPSEFKTLMYAGVLSQHHGILNLLEAFGATKQQHYRLWLCGKGDAQIKVLEAARADKRIKYFSALSTNALLRMEAQATALINPRSPDEECAKYYFPSKTLEFMLSGNPVITAALPGIPVDYLEYLHVLPKTTVHCIGEAIERVLNTDDDSNRAFGMRAREYLIQTRHYTIQGEKIRQLYLSLNPHVPIG